MPTFETLPRFEKDWKNLTPPPRGRVLQGSQGAFVPDLIAPFRPFRPSTSARGRS
jgi:hypothetical protein